MIWPESKGSPLMGICAYGRKAKNPTKNLRDSG
jgi:hypothetical protein